MAMTFEAVSLNPIDDPRLLDPSPVSARVDSRSVDRAPEPGIPRKPASRVTTRAEVDKSANEDPRARDGNVPPGSPLQSLFQGFQRKLTFHIDDATKRVVITVVDSETDEVVRQVPPEEILRLAASLEEVRGSFYRSKV
jgi:flagellar protein FlaG